jgi:NlpE N-terminal domain/NlpE C-terminal OB domain
MAILDRAMRHALLLCLTIFAGGLGGCGGGADTRDTPTPMAPGLPGVYAGTFPCSNCEGIAATLWVREDGRFILRQRYVGKDAGAAPPSYAFGKWSWDEHTAELVLESVGPTRRLSPLDTDTLELKTASHAPHVLARDAGSPAFADRVLIDGETVVAKTGATFRQCVTELELPIADVAAYKELRRQHRALNAPGKPALTTVEAHFVAAPADGSGPESLVIDKVVQLKPGAHC